MLTLQLWTASGEVEVKDFRYRLLVGDRRVCDGKIEGHVIADGWPVLVGKIVDAHKGVMLGKEFNAVAALTVHDGGKPRRRRRRAA